MLKSYRLIPPSIMFCLCVVDLALIAARTHGAVLFTLDDPYIHLTVARNLALHGAYGINAGEFTAPSSSILYPFILLPGVAAGFGQSWDWIICIASAVASIIIAGRCLELTGYRLDLLPKWLLALASLAVCLSFNLAGLAGTGMEHSLHVAICLGCVLGVLLFLQTGRVMPIWLVCAFLCPLIRYEGVTFWLASVALLASYRRWKIAALLFAVTFAVLAAFSAMLMAHGLAPLPNSVLAKTMLPAAGTEVALHRLLLENLAIETGGFLAAGLAAFLFNRRAAGWLAGIALLIFLLRCLLIAFWLNTDLMHVSSVERVLTRQAGAFGFVQMVGIGVLAVCALPAAWRQQNVKNVGLAAFATFILAGHLVFGQFGWLTRYEIYALTSGALLAALIYAPQCTHFVAHGRSLDRAAAVAMLPLLLSVYTHGCVQAPHAAEDIYLQQHQMARFVATEWRAPVAVNDLGQVSYRNSSYVLDLWGLASYEALRERTQTNGSGWMGRLTREHHVRLAMIYSDLFTTVPPGWVLAGKLSTRTPVVFLSSPDVYFYATTADGVPDVRAALSRFSPTLPQGSRVIVDRK